MADTFSISLKTDEVELLKDFLQAGLEQIADLEGLVLQLEESAASAPDTVQGVFRVIHTIKGTSGFFGLAAVERLGHRMEALLDLIRKGRLTVDSDITDCLLAGLDLIKRMLDAVAVAVGSGQQSGSDVTLTVEAFDSSEILEWIESEMGRAGTPKQEEEKSKPKATVSAGPVTSVTFVFAEEMVQDFVGEAMENLEGVEAAILAIEQQPASAEESLGAMLRGFHTVKGNAGVLLSHIDDQETRRNHLLNRIRILAHGAESLLQTRRNAGQMLFSQDLDLLFRVDDLLKRLVKDFSAGDAVGLDISHLLVQCERAAGMGVTLPGEIPGPGRNPEDEAPAPDAFAETLRQVAGELEAGLKDVLDDARHVQALVHISAALERLKTVGQEDGQQALLKIAEEASTVVTFLKGDWSEVTAAICLRDLEQLVATLRGGGVEPLPPERQEVASQPQALGEGAAPLPAPPKGEGSSPSALIKVPQERLDQLMNLIGELLVCRSSLNHLPRVIAVEDRRPDIAARVKDVVGAVDRIGDELQAAIMAVRMTPVGHVFAKFPRLVRDLARKLHKKIRLEMEGAETELDKTVIEAIGDPLVHLVRNAADHGLESPEKRRKVGKPEEGTIRLSAFNQAQSVRVEIIDDGKGMDARAIRAKAVERGMDKDAIERMTDQEAYNLIFESGFSTVGRVTEVSGRGVGMDVVRKGVEAIGGSVYLESRPGQGAKVVMHLPLTLAVNRGLEVAAADEHFYLPLEYVVETVKASRAAFHTHRGDRMVVVRGEILPVRDLAAVLALPGSPSRLLAGDKQEEKKSDACSLVILHVDGRRLALLVDRFYREGEYVLKSLPRTLGNVPAITGAMITSEGRVILVLDPVHL